MLKINKNVTGAVLNERQITRTGKRWPLVALCIASFSTPVQLHAEELVGNVAAGAEVYKAVCSGCHNVSIAPSLRGIIDRPAASLASFAGYSEALKAKKDITWSKENLDKFLTNPQALVPGTLMVQEIPEAQKRADIIAFLATLPPPRR